MNYYKRSLYIFFFYKRKDLGFTNINCLSLNFWSCLEDKYSVSTLPASASQLSYLKFYIVNQNLNQLWNKTSSVITTAAISHKESKL